MAVLARAQSADKPGIHETHAQPYRHDMTAYHDKSKHQRKTEPAWRPTFHLTAPHGWLNDPCGPGYDPTTELYHLSFQWNPKENDWGNVSWGHSVSRDLVEWETSPVPCLTPSTQYDRCGVFTGCMRPTDAHGKPGALTYLYTSVRHLPIHYSMPYTIGCETLSMAISRDGGKTWKRPDCNPILPGPPENVNVTGWRDPYISSWPTMHTGSDSDLYGFISGGIAAETPTVFVYSVNPKDLREWKYIGPLINVGLNFRPSRWSGDFGVNWEVATLATLSDDKGTSRDFVVVGTEGCKETGHQPKRAPRGQLWMSVSPRSERKSTSDALRTYGFAGIFDHGCFYAANAFFDPVTGKQLVYGWIMEEDLPDALRHPQGWSGLISLPRVMSLTTLQNVKRARRSELESITSIETEDAGTGTCTIRTLGVQPDQRIEKLRANASRRQISGLKLNPEGFTLPLTTSKWELDAEFAVGNQCTSVGVEIDHGDSNCTTLTWTPSTETFQINRPNPIPDFNINNFPEKAPHTLFTTSDPETGTESEEPLRVHAYFDISVLEVFVNERTVISTRIYPLSEHCAGLRFFGDANTTLSRADLWDGLGAMHQSRVS